MAKFIKLIMNVMQSVYILHLSFGNRVDLSFGNILNNATPAVKHKTPALRKQGF